MICRRRRSLYIFISSLFTILIATSSSFAEGSRSPDLAVSESKRSKRVYTTVRIQGTSPKIDGKLDDACWREQGKWTDEFDMAKPVYGGKPTLKTEMKVLYDDRNIYVALRAYEDDVTKIARTASDRDQFDGDSIGIVLDSYFDKRSGIEFSLTAAGQKVDLHLQDAVWDFSFNAVWEGKTSIESNAWTAEFMIPLSQLRYNPKNTVWGMYAGRFIERKKEESNWSLLANDDSGYAKSFGELRGLEGLKSPLRIEIVPYSFIKMEKMGRTSGVAPLQTRKRTLSAGVDAKVGLSSSLTLDASILPDFGQVDADLSVMNLSTVETFLEERRSLFIEGKDIFEFPFIKDQIFYSRRIGQTPSVRPNGLVSAMPESTTLLGAAKLSGKTENGWSVGLLTSVTAEETAEVNIAGKKQSALVEPQTTYLVARAQKDFRGGDTNAGVILTRVDRDLKTAELRTVKPSSATVLGADFYHSWNDREFFVQGVALHSFVQGDKQAIGSLQLAPTRYFQRPIDGRMKFDPNRSSLSGSGLLIKGGKGSKGNWRYNESLMIKTPGLEYNDLGYLSVTDRVQQTSYVSYNVKTPSSWYRTYSHEFVQDNFWTTHGEFLNSHAELNSYMELANKWELWTYLIYTGNGFDPSILRGGPMMRVPSSFCSGFTVSTPSSKPVFSTFHWCETRSRDKTYFNQHNRLKVSYRPAPSVLLSAEVTYTQEKDMLRQIGITDSVKSPGWFVSHLEGKSLSCAFRAQWIIRPELRLQYYGNPFGSTLRQSEFRRVVNPLSSSSDARFGPTLNPTYRNGTYSFDEDSDGSVDYTLANPDGNSSSFRSNLVLKWEYHRGSMLYLVWSQQRNDDYKLASDTPSDALAHLKKVAPNNQFMVKMTYWFNI